MTEHMYYNANNPFPTLARGLFTEEIEEGHELSPGIKGKEVPRDRIVARGYDKFFNINEVEWATVSLPLRFRSNSKEAMLIRSSTVVRHTAVY